jgi:hypothetical protein
MDSAQVGRGLTARRPVVMPPAEGPVPASIVTLVTIRFKRERSDCEPVLARELPLSAVRAIEDDLGRLVVGEVGRPALPRPRAATRRGTPRSSGLGRRSRPSREPNPSHSP